MATGDGRNPDQGMSVDVVASSQVNQAEGV